MKVREFAEMQGVTPQAVYKLIKTHNEVLTGHVLKAKKNTELDEYAVVFLKGRMVEKTAVVTDRGYLDQIEELKQQLKKAQDELILKNQLLINSQNEVLKIVASRDDDIKAAEAKLKLELESHHRENEKKIKVHYQEEIKRLQNELKVERERKWKFPWSR